MITWPIVTVIVTAGGAGEDADAGVGGGADEITVMMLLGDR
jgi:hypothetical protein